MGIELEWFVLFAVAVLGNAVFGVFEVETPWWRRLLKWTFIAAVTYFLYGAVGHWALAWVVGLSALGLTVHFSYCRKHGIHPIKATPRRRYYESRGWSWPE